MPIITTTMTTAQNLAANVALIITPTGQLAVDGSAITLGGGNRVTIDGAVSSLSSAIFETSNTAGNNLYVGSHGTVSSALTTFTTSNASTSFSNAGGISSSSSSAIYSTGVGFQFINTGVVQGGLTIAGANARLENLGQITAVQNVPIYVSGAGVVILNSGDLVGSGSGFESIRLLGADATVTNTGRILGNGGLTYNGAGGTFTLNNSGEIRDLSNYSAITIYTSPTFILNNSGSMFGTIFGSGGTDTITNSGSISGQIQTGAGQDTVLNSGHIYGGGLIGSGSLTVTNTFDGNIDSSIFAGNGLTVRNYGHTAGISGANQTDFVLNAGVIGGSVSLGGGTDVYDGVNGLVTGTVSGGAGDDTLSGGSGRDVFYGDNVSGDTTGGADTLTGGYGDDVLNGGYGADALYGNQDNDILYGNQDNDWIHGGQGDDILYGGQGNDTLNGGVGDDVLYGNAGDDLFVFSARGFGHDVIGDFRAAGANDRIQVSPDIFADFADLQAHAAAVTGGTLLTDAAGDTVLLLGISPGALTTDMFTFT